MAMIRSFSSFFAVPSTFVRVPSLKIRTRHIRRNYTVLNRKPQSFSESFAIS